MHARCISWMKWEGKREEEEAFHWQDYRPRHDWRNWREKWNDTIHDWPPPLANWFVTASCVNDLRGNECVSTLVRTRSKWKWVQFRDGHRGGWRRGVDFTWRVILRRPKLWKNSFKKLLSRYWIEIYICVYNLSNVISYSFFFENYEKSVDDY